MFIKNLDITGDRISLLLGRILSQCEILKDIRLYLSGIKLSKHTLREFLGDVFTNRADIKHIFVNLSDTNICDDDLCQFSLNLPQIRVFRLSLHRTRVTNRIIEWLTGNVLTAVSCLKTFHLYLSGTQITDTPMEKLFSGFGKIYDQNLDLGRTKITNKTLEALSQAMPTFANGIQEFGIDLDNTDVTDEGVPLIFMNLPNMISMTLGLSATKITDKTIELLAQKTLSFAPKLSSFTLLLQKVAVTDNSLQQIFETLPMKLKELEFGFDMIKVTDRSIAPFITERVPAMKELKKFKLFLSNTNVSPEVQAKIRELENRINSNQ